VALCFRDAADVVVTLAMDERSQARVLALQALCLLDGPAGDYGGGLESFLRDPENYADLGWPEAVSPAVVTQAHQLARSAWEHRVQGDEWLNRFATNWTVAQMQPVDRNILRLGAYELLERPDVPPSVVIAEAVALADQFTGREARALVNGVLDAIRRALKADHSAPPPAETPKPET